MTRFPALRPPIMDTNPLIALIVAAFSAATLLPTASEAIFVWALQQQPQQAIIFWLAASLANTSGSLTSYAIGRLLPQRQRIAPRTQGYLKQYGSRLLLLSWLPIVGDALPLAAGYLRLPLLACSCAIFIGKTARYGMIYWTWLQVA